MGKHDDIGVGYQVAVNLWSTVVQSSWSRFNAMLIANSIIIGLIGILLINYETAYVTYVFQLFFATFLSAIGILLACLWYSLMARDAKFQKYYAISARNLERRLFAGAESEDPSVPHLTVLHGAKLSDGFVIKSPDDPVDSDHIDVNEKNVLQMTGTERWKTGRTVKLIIIIFGFLYTIFCTYCIYNIRLLF